MRDIPPNPRHAIHEAFAHGVRSPDRNTVGAGTKFDAVNQMAIQVLGVGKIMAAMERVSELHVKLALYINAPDGFLDDEQKDQLYKGLIDLRTEKYGPPGKQEGALSASFQKLLDGYVKKCINPRAPSEGPGRCVASLNTKGEGKIKAEMQIFNQFLDVVQTLDHESLMPVQEMIDEYYDRRAVNE